MPKIYDTERTIRVLGVDGAENYVKVNSVELIRRLGRLNRSTILRAGAMTLPPSR